MNQGRRAAVQACLLLVAMCASAAVKNNIRIKVLDSETRSLSLADNGVPMNCDQITFDAYCRSTRTPQITSTLLVQEGDGPPFRISCTIDSKYSRCRPLPKGESFDARREKHGLVVYYVDDKGKARKQLYTLVDAEGNTSPPTTAAAVPTQPVLAAATARRSSPVPAPAPSAVSAWEVLPGSIKCNFSSMPSSAEITLDGKYVGNTPSEIAVSPGAHVVVFSMPGFAQWMRNLTVEAGSGVVNVTASLQKTQP